MYLFMYRLPIYKYMQRIYIGYMVSLSIYGFMFTCLFNIYKNIFIEQGWCPNRHPNYFPVEASCHPPLASGHVELP